jgi:predicted enzyme related to lactoylglutathione lyase
MGLTHGAGGCVWYRTDAVSLGADYRAMKKLLMRRESHRIRVRLFITLLIIVGILPAAAISSDVPSITHPANKDHLVGKVIWLDLETVDPARAKKFYAGLFGWDFRNYRAAGTDYAVAMSGGRPVAGVLQRQIRKGEERRSAWLPFISVRDVDAAARIALQHHAQMVSEPENVPLRGRQALLTDPEGARFALTASSSGDPPDGLPTAGTWVWTSLFARDSADEAVFYQETFGFNVTGMPTHAGFERIRLSSSGHGRIGISELPADTAPLHAHWINYVCVGNATDAIARASSLGGHVLVKAERDNHGDIIAILADPTGASFGVMELPPVDVAAGPR